MTEVLTIQDWEPRKLLCRNQPCTARGGRQTDVWSQPHTHAPSYLLGRHQPGKRCGRECGCRTRLQQTFGHGTLGGGSVPDLRPHTHPSPSIRSSAVTYSPPRIPPWYKIVVLPSRSSTVTCSPSCCTHSPTPTSRGQRLAGRRRSCRSLPMTSSRARCVLRPPSRHTLSHTLTLPRHASTYT